MNQNDGRLQRYKQIFDHLELLDSCTINSASVSINTVVDDFSSGLEQEDMRKYQRTLRTFEYEGSCSGHKFKLIMEEV